jgi:hypothetical protein
MSVAETEGLQDWPRNSSAAEAINECDCACTRSCTICWQSLVRNVVDYELGNGKSIPVPFSAWDLIVGFLNRQGPGHDLRLTSRAAERHSLSDSIR